jgi:hypothetical protein
MQNQRKNQNEISEYLLVFKEHIASVSHISAFLPILLFFFLFTTGCRLAASFGLQYTKIYRLKARSFLCTLLLYQTYFIECCISFARLNYYH